ncbi:transcriptional repressor [Streptomyces sp. 8K308]|uniref:Fur family transcriptional regulator n=1 Tax=Streptomyces sp. 8K308 TaxID=2530388 RepID=UPI0010516513|nr:transcriptional repressor [Streptomyces sp. 8K308]TDC25826.1 transcriptional repressor [Streptomyces sp. 8K308]
MVDHRVIEEPPGLPPPRRRATPQRVAVEGALRALDSFVSAQRLRAEVVARGARVGLTTVYRVLRELEGSGRVDVVRDEVGERLYRLRPADGHRHYLICRGCDVSRPVESEVVEAWAERVGADAGFAALAHTVQLTGLCGRCHEPPGHGGPARER